ncbi:POK19 protein, partial [Geococcyx californianus]|nr:POK19 protein [Geococcyx californianus]
SWEWIAKPLFSLTPLSEALTVYTDAGRKSHKAAVVWRQEMGPWKTQLIQGLSQDSLQTLELRAVIWALQTFDEPLNIVTDSLYVVGVVARIESSAIKEIDNKWLFSLFV